MDCCQSSFQGNNTRKVTVTTIEGDFPAHADGEMLCYNGTSLSMENLCQPNWKSSAAKVDSTSGPYRPLENWKYFVQKELGLKTQNFLKQLVMAGSPA